jgi:hypothetical protein
MPCSLIGPVPGMSGTIVVVHWVCRTDAILVLLAGKTATWLGLRLNPVRRATMTLRLLTATNIDF